MHPFSDEIDPLLRQQILLYHSTATMADSERANVLGLPEGCRIREGAKIISQEKLSIGTNCWIGENAILDASGGLEVGSSTSIGLSVFVWTHDSHLMNIDGDNSREDNHRIKRRATKIGNNCFIAGHSVIMPGVTIGDSCIIGPLSVVYNDLPDNSTYTPYRDFYKQKNTITKLEKRIMELEKLVLNKDR
ncbi:acyltransferase [Paremcibacter congregatus]|uniref:Acetyltransferase n=1 Tax=Paremcibacter congregatus TaxID=2043170 RepID=A0A2G4YRA6_9PROT|nr:acyltransferase [Paremcibacter congregatus]PHZ84845.1 acetyltransferase [Paremcibacter congregatus]QDE26182.1 acyltransferase [Paremcibacter congregatus]